MCNPAIVAKYVKTRMEVYTKGTKVGVLLKSS